MAFLFKSKKNQDRALASRDGAPGSQGSMSTTQRVVRDDKGSLSRSTPTGSLNSLENDGSAGSPDQSFGRRGPSVDQQGPQQPSDLAFRNGPPLSNPNASLYPWSQRRLTYTSSHPSPFPRYGAAVNSMSSKEGDIYIMGGLINSSTVKGDLWMIEAGGNMACYPLATTAEGPGPRVGHASLLVGNAFIVFGGDTKIDEADILDETLYLLNTSTRQWSRSLPVGTRPSGRYGHSLNILGSKIYIFGGQVEGYFMNDLAAFDLNQLQMPNNRWEMLIPNTEPAGPPAVQVPQARTNHTIVTYNDKLYLFGGTNGYQWFNDVWCYDPATNKWSQLDCIGYIPVPREGHAAAIVDDVMYIFGGRTEEGQDLGDLAAFRISSRRWYTFQNMGPSPSSRSGHSMTTVGKLVVVVGGEPSSAASTVNDLGIVYVLDTSKIRYPNDSQPQGASQRIPQARRPSASEQGTPGTARQLTSRDGASGPPDPKRLIGAPRDVSSPTNGFRQPPTNGIDVVNGPLSTVAAAPKLVRPPGPTGPSGPSGPPPQGPTPAKPTVNTTSLGRPRGPSQDRSEPPVVSPQSASTTQSPLKEVLKEAESPLSNGRRTPTTQQPSRPAPKPESATIMTAETPKLKPPRQGRGQGSVDSSTEPALKVMTARPSSPPPPTRQPSNPLSRRSSGRNSQTVALLKELDAARNRNAWYASELELARKAGYTPNATLSPVFDSRATETFDDEDKPLIEALLTMRSELANVQSAVDKQAILAAKQIAEAEKQRDAAIQEAVYAKAKLAAHMGGSIAGSPQIGSDRDADGRSSEISKKLATTLNFQKQLQSRIESMNAEVEAERRARQLADDTTNASQKRMSELEAYKSQTSAELERLRAELHMVQREAREQSVAAQGAVQAMELLKVEKEEFQAKYNEAMGSSKESNGTFQSLRAAVAASDEMKALLKRRLDEEQGQREKLETRYNKLKSEHEARMAELVSASQRLRDAEELAEKHANEARTHQQAVLSGLDKISTRDPAKSSSADAERVATLQSQVASANALAKKYQQEADAASDRLRAAEERIAGLEAYQEQSSREGVAIRRQLQAALKDTQTLQAANSDLRNQLASQQLETNAMTVQHNTLKDILSERGISPTSAVRSRGPAGGMGSPRNSSPEQARLRDLEQQLAAAAAAHEETKMVFTSQAQESEAAYRDKLSQLESDYQSAVHYVKGTERVLKQLKEQLARYKTENARLKSEYDELEDKANEAVASSAAAAAASSAPADWEKERDGLQQKVDALQEEVRSSTNQLERQLSTVRRELDEARRDRDAAAKSSDEAGRRLGANRRDLEQLQQENAQLERRAQDAEQKVALLLDQVESSVDNYRRRSRQVLSMSSELGAGGIPGVSSGVGAGASNGASGLGHARNESSEAESLYGGGGGLDARNSRALDNLANELETLRTQWESNSKAYRLSNAFDFETGSGAVGGGGGKLARESDGGPGLSESLADWRKRLDHDEREENRSQSEERGIKSKTRS